MSSIPPRRALNSRSGFGSVPRLSSSISFPGAPAFHPLPGISRSRGWSAFLPCDILFAVTRTVRLVVLALFIVGSAMFWVAIFLRHANPAKADMAQTLQSFGLLMAAMALAIGMLLKRKGPKG